MGHDWEGEFDFLKEQCEVVYLNRTEGISTTQIKEELYGKEMNFHYYFADHQVVKLTQVTFSIYIVDY